MFLASHYNLFIKVVDMVYPTDDYYTPQEVRYLEQTSLYEVYERKNAEIVMLGDSITYRANWGELLKKEDVVNRGIGRDTTQGMLNRLNEIISLNPSYVFIMAGINDINRGSKTGEVFKRYKTILNKLKENNIQTVIQSTLYKSPKQRNYKETNQEVKKLNVLLKEYANANKIIFVDLNEPLSNGRHLNGNYTFDGTHINGKAYKIWSNEINKILTND